MGVVWEAEHTGVGRRVALKLLHKALVEKEGSMLSRLQREARLAGSLESPHIATVLDTGVDPDSGSPYLVMEYLVGEDLATLISRAGKLPVSLALRIAAQASLGLKKAHDAKIIHRDVKPANIFLARRDGKVTVKVVDFGIAKLRVDELASSLEGAALTRTGSLIGSPLFMSPEQARGVKGLDHRADVWSLGVVLFNMLTGRTPYESIDALGELILAICSVSSPSVRDYTPEVPMDVAELVQRALQIAPTARFQDAGEMYEALRSKIDGPMDIEESVLEQFPELGPRSRRVVVETPAGGTELLADGQARDASGSRSDPAVAVGSVSMTMANPPSADGAAAAGSAGPPVLAVSAGPVGSAIGSETRESATSPSGVADPARAAAPRGGGSNLGKIAGAAAAVGVGALAAWALLSGPSSGSAPRAAGTQGAAPTATSAVDVAASETVVVSTASVAPSVAPTVTVEASSAPPAPDPSASAAPAERPRPGPMGGPTGRPTAKPVDTSGFGDRK